MAEYPDADWAGVSPNKSPRQGTVKLFIVHHYAGMTDPLPARQRFMRANDRSVSPNYQVNADGSVFEIVPPDHYRAWTTGAIDHQAVTCETENISGAPNWGISRASMDAIAALVAWASKRYGFPIQRGRVDDGNIVRVPGVVGHRETPAGRQTSTSCPGPSMDIDYIVRKAREIANPTPEPQEIGDIEMRHIYNTDDPNNETRRATVGELTFHVVGPGISATERDLWGDPVGRTQAEWDNALDMVNTRRAMNGLPPLKGVRGEFSTPKRPV